MGFSRNFMAATALLALGCVKADAQQPSYWETPAAQRYLASPAPPPAYPLPDGTNLRAAAINVPFPILGLLRDFYNPNPATNVREAFLDPAAQPPAENWWPTCAKADPIITKAESTGWITLNYDFGCIHVSIAGDVTDSPQDANRSTTLENNSERVGDRVSAADEADEPSKITSVSWDINRNRVPHTVSIDCTGEGRAFCQDRTAQATLIARLSIVGGSRTP